MLVARSHLSMARNLVKGPVVCLPLRKREKKKKNGPIIFSVGKPIHERIVFNAIVFYLSKGRLRTAIIRNA